MKNIMSILSLLFFLTSCKKPVSYNPGMIYTDLENKEIKFNQSSSIDFNHDAVMDLRFYTMFLGDPIAQQDKKKYLVIAKINCFLPINSNENAPMLKKGESVPLENFSGYNWCEMAQVELAQKVIGISGDPFWEGLWKSSSHKFLPVQIKVNNQRFNGWLELSIDINSETLILHKAAISKLPEMEVIVGV